MLDEKRAVLTGVGPSLHWNQFDSYLHPAGTYFGSKVGARLEHVAYNYESKDVWLINRSIDRSGARTVEVDVIGLDGSEISSTSYEIETEANTSKRLKVIEGIKEGIVFVRLVLRDGDEVLSRNVYWIAASNDGLDWAESTWYHTPVTSFADYKALFSLEPATVAASASAGDGGAYTVTLENESTVPAFFVRLNLVDGDEKDVNPVTWSDNYVTLWPGETLELSVRGWDEAGSKVLIDGANVEAYELSL